MNAARFIVMNSVLRVRLLFALAALVLAALSLVAVRHFQHTRPEPFRIPDEKAVAAALLEQKLGGPLYFHPGATASKDPRAAPDSSNGEPRISVRDAKAQVERIARERHFDAERTARLEALIDRLAEPPASRVIGEPAVNRLRLNLTLDATL